VINLTQSINNMFIRQVPIHSANWSIRETVKYGICMHHIVGTLLSATQAFQNSNRKASAHFGVGETEVVQYVPIDKVAFHAGDSDPFDENGSFIGIEHEGGWILPDGSRQKPTHAVHLKSVELCIEICKKMGWRKLIVVYEPDQRNMDPTELINKYKGQGVGIVVRHKNIVNTNTSCSGLLDVEWIVDRVNEQLPIFFKSENKNIMNKETFKSYINQPGRFEDSNGGGDSTRRDLMDAVDREDYLKLIDWLGDQRLKQVEQLKSELNNQVPIKIQPTEEEIQKIIAEKGYKSSEEVNQLIKKALEDAVGVDNNENPIVIAPPIINIPQSKAPWKSKKFLSLIAFFAGQLSYLYAFAPVLASALASVAGYSYDISLALVLAGVGVIDAIILGLYQVMQGKQDIASSFVTVNKAWADLVSRLPKKKA